MQDTCKEILVSNKFGPLTQASASKFIYYVLFFYLFFLFIYYIAVLLLVHDEAFEPALNYYVTVAKNFEKV